MKQTLYMIMLVLSVGRVYAVEDNESEASRLPWRNIHSSVVNVDLLVGFKADVFLTKGSLYERSQKLLPSDKYFINNYAFEYEMDVSFFKRMGLEFAHSFCGKYFVVEKSKGTQYASGDDLFQFTDVRYGIFIQYDVLTWFGGGSIDHLFLRLSYGSMIKHYVIKEIALAKDYETDFYASGKYFSLSVLYSWEIISMKIGYTVRDLEYKDRRLDGSGDLSILFGFYF